MKKADVFFENLAADLIASIRGRKSQTSISNRLGYTYNIVSKWENKTRPIRWDEFVKLASLLKTSALSALQEIYIQPSDESASAILKELRGQTSYTEFSKSIRATRLKVAAWEQGTQIPKLSEVLQLIHFKRDGVAAFCLQLSPGYAVSLPLEMQTALSLNSLICKYPWLITFTQIFQLQDCPGRDQAAQFAHRVSGIDPELAEAAIQALEKIGYLRSDEANRIVIESNKPKTSSKYHNIGSEQRRAMMKELVNISTATMESLWLSGEVKQNEDNSYQGLTACVSKNGWEKIRAATRGYVESLKDIIELDAVDGVGTEIKIINVLITDIRTARCLGRTENR